MDKASNAEPFVQSHPLFAAQDFLRKHLHAAPMALIEPEELSEDRRLRDFLVSSSSINANYLKQCSALFSASTIRDLTLASYVKPLRPAEIAALEQQLNKPALLRRFIESRTASYRQRYLNEYAFSRNVRLAFPFDYLWEFMPTQPLPESISVSPDLSVDFIYCIKNRKNRCQNSLRSLALAAEAACSLVNFSVLVAEDVSEDMLDPDSFSGLGYDIQHIVVDTGVAWTRSGLLNRGLFKSKAKLVCFVDADTLFPLHFFDQLEASLHTVDFDKHVLAINMIETHAHKKGSTIHPEGTPYSYMWTMAREKALSVGGYDEGFTGWGSEDRDFQYRLETLAGLKPINSISISSEFIVHHLSHTVRDGAENKIKNREFLAARKAGVEIRNAPRRPRIRDVAQITHYSCLPASQLTGTLLKELQSSVPQNEILIIMGNGPSLKHIDFNLFKGFDSFGLNSAYRFYDELGFYPTYFGCFDNLVTTNHREGFQKLLADPSVPIRKFFFIQEFEDPLSRFHHVKYSSQDFAEQRTRTHISRSLDDFWIYENSGASALHAGLAMGYKKIILVGVDCSYVQVVEGAETYRGKKNELVIKSTPKANPNYWRDDYQVSGDVYHVPDADKFQKPEWERIARNLAGDPHYSSVEVFNCSTGTKLDCFTKAPLHRVLPVAASALLSDVTFLIKAFGRTTHVENLVASIRRFYADSPITVLDDSGALPQAHIDYLAGHSVHLIQSEEFDIGLSEGRNRLVSQCNTRYMVLLDDDFLFTEKTDIVWALRLLSSTSLDIVGGSVFDVGAHANRKDQPRTFHGNLRLAENLFIEAPIESRLSIEGIPLIDLVMNFFIAKTDSVKKVLWTAEFKLGEHLDFFLRAKEAELNITFLPGIQVNHVRDMSLAPEEYLAYRRRAGDFHKVFKQKYAISRIFQFGKEIDG